MKRYFVHRIGPGHALGVGCAVGVVLGLLPVLSLVAAALIVQANQAEIMAALGPWAEPLALQPGVPWNAVGLASLFVLLAFALIYGLGAWLAALGFNLVARVTGGLALDVGSDSVATVDAPPEPLPQLGAAQWDPTVPLSRPQPVAAPAAPRPEASLYAAAAAAQPAPPVEAPQLQPEATPLAAQFWLVAEADATSRWALHKPTTTIGSDPANDVVLAGDPLVAPRHAEIRVESPGYVLYDLESPQGSLVNGRRIQTRNLLKDGFRVQLGETALLFRREPSGPAVGRGDAP